MKLFYSLSFFYAKGSSDNFGQEGRPFPSQLKLNFFLVIAYCLLLLLALSCKEPETPNPYPKLVLLSTHPLDILEPSGLSLGANPEHLWTVSDKRNKAYRLTLSGEVIDSLDYKGDDLEGITFDASDSTFWLVEERERKLVHLDQEGRVLHTFSPILPQTEANKGMEGISIDSEGGNLYALIEDKPGTLLHFNLNGELQMQFRLNFAKDYSGVFYDSQGQNLWIISDQSQSISRCSLEGLPEESFSLNISKAEGIAIDFAQGKIYVVSDSEEALYVFKLPE